MAGARLNTFQLNTTRLNNGTAYPYSYRAAMLQMWDSKPVTKVEFIKVDGSVVDISNYYDIGAKFSQTRDRAAAEIQAGDFDVVLFNHDNYFSEYDPNSLLYNLQYHGAKIRVSLGFIFPDGTVGYETQGVGYIDQLVADPSESKITFRCRDIVKFILDQQLNVSPIAELPDYGAGNFGDGFISAVAVRPFKTKNEDWTLTCTLLGGDSVATFSVVGSVSGNVGTATSGVEFSTGTGAGGIKFTITAGTNVWHVGDTITFSTKQFPEWSGVNLVKIIWSILTGYNWDSNTQEVWSDRVFAFDHTKSTANVHLDYAAFAAVITTVDSFGTFDLTGYIARDSSASSILKDLMLMVLGSFFSNADGLLSVKVYDPATSIAADTSFKDTRKITVLGYNRNIEEVINYAVVDYKKTLNWSFSDQDLTLDGKFVSLDSDSITKYGALSQGWQLSWYAPNGYHARDMADKVISRYKEPPTNIDFNTGSDALRIMAGDTIAITDEKYGFNGTTAEVVQITKNIDERPINISIRARRDATLSYIWGVIGSEVDEGDGISPQSDDYDTASVTDKQFAYFSQVGSPAPDYRMF